FDDSAAVLLRAETRGLKIPPFTVLRHDLAFLAGDSAAMERIAASGGDTPEADDLTQHEASALAFRGQLRFASDRARHAADLAEAAGRPERTALFHAGHAVWAALFGKTDEAQAAASHLLQLRDRDVEYGVAFALGEAGDAEQSSRLADDLE